MEKQELEQLELRLADLQAQMRAINEERSAIYLEYSNGMVDLRQRQAPLKEEINIIDRQVRELKQKRNKTILNRCVPLSKVLTTKIPTASDLLTELRFFSKSGLELAFNSVRFRYRKWSDDQKIQYDTILKRYGLQLPSPNMYQDYQSDIRVIREILNANLPMATSQTIYYKETGNSASRIPFLSMLVDIHYKKQDD